MVVVDMCKNVCALVSVVLIRTPDHLHCFIVESDLLVLVVNSCKEKGIEAELTE